MTKLFHFHATVRTSIPAQGEGLVSSLRKRSHQPSSSRFRSQLLLEALAFATLLMLVLVELASAGGPKYIAGISYFNAGLAGQPITWSGGTITYYTDQGDLSPLLRGTDADAFVADAFTRWTGINTAAVSATRGGQLAERTSAASTSF